jgi:hypothetical protein
MRKPSSVSSLSAASSAAGVSLVLMLLGGCGKAPAPTAASTDAAPIATATGTAATGDAGSVIPAPPAQAAAGMAGRTGVLTNPGNTQMVFLYYDLAGIPPPIDQWVVEDNRVTSAPGAKKAERREQVKAELQAGLAAVKGVGVLHLSTYAQLSQYDPTYGEFTVGALSPASQYGFEALDRQVTVTLDNGLDAQTWSVPADQSQAIIDKIGDHSLMLDAVLKITRVLPAPDGGTLVTHVVSWNLRDPSNGTTIARVTVPTKQATQH